jgi:hypothetical protein
MRANLSILKEIYSLWFLRNVKVPDLVMGMLPQARYRHVPYHKRDQAIDQNQIYKLTFNHL